MMNKRVINKGVLEIYDHQENLIFTIDEKIENDLLKMILNGQLKNEVAHEFEDELIAALTVCPHIEIDFEGVTYIASMALRSLLSAQQMIDDIEDASMLLINVPKETMSIFEESGFIEILSINPLK